jgi:hypothetical protein
MHESIKPSISHGLTHCSAWHITLESPKQRISRDIFLTYICVTHSCVTYTVQESTSPWINTGTRLLHLGLGHSVCQALLWDRLSNHNTWLGAFTDCMLLKCYILWPQYILWHHVIWQECVLYVMRWFKTYHIICWSHCVTIMLKWQSCFVTNMLFDTMLDALKWCKFMLCYGYIV